MSSPLIDLETRRKILFADGGVTIRNLAGNSVLITLGPAGTSTPQIETIKSFLGTHFQSQKMNAIIVDVSQANYLMLQNIFAIAKLHVDEFQGLAFLTSKRMIDIAIRLVTFSRKSRHHIKIFKTFNLALKWSRTLN